MRFIGLGDPAGGLYGIPSMQGIPNIVSSCVMSQTGDVRRQHLEMFFAVDVDTADV